MTIRDKLRLATFIAIGVSLLAGFSVVSRNAAISELVEDNRIVSEVVKGVFDLTILTNEYSLRHEQRTRHQWWSRYESNGELLRQAAASGHLESETLLGDLSKHHEGNGENFSRLENALGETSKDATSLALQQRLVGRLSIGAQEIVSRSLTLAKHSRRTLADEQRQLGIFLALSIIGLALVVTIGSLFINRGILKSLGILQQGAEIVGTGDLNHRIGATTRDEFGQLAHAFDQMTENVSASRDELEKEVGERKRAEAVLAQQAEELERSNQELDSFAHTASHDLKAPARRMAQFCQLLERIGLSRAGRIVHTFV